MGGASLLKNQKGKRSHFANKLLGTYHQTLQRGFKEKKHTHSCSDLNVGSDILKFWSNSICKSIASNRQRRLEIQLPTGDIVYSCDTSNTPNHLQTINRTGKRVLTSASAGDSLSFIIVLDCFRVEGDRVVQVDDRMPLNICQ